MIKVTLKLLFLCATIITVTGFQVLAEDSKDKKIEQLESLLSNFIFEENLALKNENTSTQIVTKLCNR